MDNLEKTNARKSTKISFRTDDTTLAKLKAVCRIENKTISSLIEDVLPEHVLLQENPLSLHGEKRQSPRKQCSISAVLFSKNNGSTVYRNGTIVDISQSSMQIILRNTPDGTIFENGFQILFSLPNHEHPLLVSCNFIRATHLHDESMIVARFECTESLENNMLQQFLLTNTITTENTSKKKQR